MGVGKMNNNVIEIVGENTNDVLVKALRKRNYVIQS